MLFRVALMLIVLSGSASALLYLAVYTNYFNKDRLLKFARNAGLLAVGLLIGLITIGLLVQINA